MITHLFCCHSCDYTSNRKYNLQLHTRRIHHREATIEEKSDVETLLEDEEILSEVVNDSEEILPEITEILPILQKKNLNCPKCLKKFKTFHGLKEHIPKCKGVSNPLECHHCHVVFASASSKCRHIKICKVKKAKEIIEQAQTIISNNTNNTNNNTVNNGQINNYNTINVYQAPLQRNRNKAAPDIIDDDSYYDVENINDFGKEDISYICEDQMKKIAMNMDLRSLIYEKHFNPDHPENHNIRINPNNKKSYRILKDKTWIAETEEHVNSVIYNNTKSQIYDCAFQKILNKILNEEQSDEYTSRWNVYDKFAKKKLFKYIELQIKEYIIRREKEITMMIENKNKTNRPQIIASEQPIQNEILHIQN